MKNKNLCNFDVFDKKCKFVLKKIILTKDVLTKRLYRVLNNLFFIKKTQK